MADLAREFPGYPADTLPALPAGFVDSSWRNDACPSFDNAALCLRIWCDHPDPSQREFPSNARFCVSETLPNGESRDLVCSDDWQLVLDCVASIDRGQPHD
ncbi:hypothetical protein BRAO375_3660053 [Bradyrhizobium sp. ORS 375]|nr:hypothetical protein BRAO375_3660053 [Bradyrhizobium sp. ORS 375]